MEPRIIPVIIRDYSDLRGRLKCLALGLILGAYIMFTAELIFLFYKGEIVL